MGNLDLSILQKIPETNLDVILEIEPLAPLSMVTELPGSYYKTLKSPDKKMLCGLFENILGWHINLADRRNIVKELIKIRKKQKLDYSNEVKGSTFTPLLMEYFEIKLKCLPSSIFYDDLWSKAYRRADAIVHPKGTFNISYDLIPAKRELQRSDKNSKQIEDKTMEVFFKDNLEQFPQYYSSPTSREYVLFNGKIEFKLTIDPDLFELMQEKLSYENIGYLGNNEGWVDIKLRKL
jgi:CRISPR-associated protein Cas5